MATAGRAGSRGSVGRRARAWWAGMAVGAAVAVLVGFVTSRGWHPNAPEAGSVGAAVGQAVPVQQVQDLQGRTVALAGKPTVLYFMAAWCASCTYGESQLRHVQAVLGNRVNLVSVDVDPVTDTPEAVAAFARRYGGDWPHALDQGQRLVTAFRIRSLDTTIVLDSRGRVVYQGGPQPGAVLTRVLKDLIGA
jgi:cytochrome oxidase Cu insertion factor (SCO1/SenC/PrrC family)